MNTRPAAAGLTGLAALTPAPAVVPLTCPGGEHLLTWAIPGVIAICDGDGHKAAVWRVTHRRGLLVPALVAEWSPTTRLLAETLVHRRSAERESVPAGIDGTAGTAGADGADGADGTPEAGTVPAVTVRIANPRGVNVLHRTTGDSRGADRPLRDIRNGIEASRGDRTALWKAFRARHPHAPAIISQLLGCSLHAVHQVDRGERVVTYEVAMRLQAIMALPAGDDQPDEPPGPMRLPDAVLGLA